MAIHGSYEYNALCQSCKFKVPASSLRLRWDGLWVCKDDWEPRHPSDFYRNRNDTHKLPFILSDDGSDSTRTWACTVSGGVTTAPVTGEIVVPLVNLLAAYYVDVLKGRTTGFVGLIRFTDVNTHQLQLVLTKSKSSSTGAGTIPLPTTAGSAGTATFKTSEQQLLGIVTIAAGATTITIPAWTAVVGNVFISFSYGT